MKNPINWGSVDLTVIDRFTPAARKQQIRLYMFLTLPTMENLLNYGKIIKQWQRRATELILTPKVPNITEFDIEAAEKRVFEGFAAGWGNFDESFYPGFDAKKVKRMWDNAYPKLAPFLKEEPKFYAGVDVASPNTQDKTAISILEKIPQGIRIIACNYIEGEKYVIDRLAGNLYTNHVGVLEIASYFKNENGEYDSPYELAFKYWGVSDEGVDACIAYAKKKIFNLIDKL